MILEKFIKQPGESKDYDIDYSEWLAIFGDTLRAFPAPQVAVSCLGNPSDTSLLCATVEVTDTFIKFWMSGGTAGQRYKLTVTATTVGGRVDESELIFIVKEF